MLVMALAATLVGFALLVVALITGTLWLAVACIVVCVLGGVFLVADLFGIETGLQARRRRRRHRVSPSADPDASEVTDLIAVVSDTTETGTPSSDVEATTEIPRYVDTGSAAAPGNPDPDAPAVDDATVTFGDPTADRPDPSGRSDLESRPHRHSRPQVSEAEPDPLTHGRHEAPTDAGSSPNAPLHRPPRHGGDVDRGL